MASVAVVTDSTAYLPEGVAARLGIRVVPLQVVVAGRVRAEGDEISSADVAIALAKWEPVSTSRPSPALFAQVYAELRAAGAKSIVSVHLSGDMSGTADAARMGAEESGADVRVVDSRTVAMGLGFGVLAAASAAGANLGVEEVAAAAEKVSAGTRAYFYVDTLEYLRRGGRIGAAQAWLGSALAVKPLLHVVDGRIAPLEKVRTTSRALSRLEDLVVAEAADGPVAVAVHHLAAPARAAALAEALDARIPKLEELYTSEVGAVVGAHVGPGMLGVVVSRTAGAAPLS
jgi:DegV family protein with EDD domain